MVSGALRIFSVAGASAFSPTRDANMNGEYLLSRTPGAPADRSFPTDFADYPGGAEYFEVYHGPIRSLYSEVFWTRLTNDLPEEIVKRFDGKAMAIIGMEIDQVRRTPDGDVPVPITHAYNHHHDTAVVGKGSSLVEFDMHDPLVKAAGRKYLMTDKHKVLLPVEHAPSSSGIPTSALFSDGNGGEYRKTFHAYSPPFAQLVESPKTISGTPMQIDTWNRDKMNISGGPFVPGPVPRASLAPVSGADAIYSGLLECPLTTRIQKIYTPGGESFNDSYVAQLTPCEHNVTAAEACFASARQLQGLENATISTNTSASDALPAGCSVAAHNDATRADVVFNTNVASSVSCGDGDASEVVGSVASLVKIHAVVSGAASQVTLTLTGPADVWFGVGFGASSMEEQPWTIVVSGNGTVEERHLDNHAPGSVIAASVKVVSNTVDGNARRVVLTRPLKGATKEHYTFSATAMSIALINAVGTGASFAVHKSASAAMLHLWPQRAACVCLQPALPFGKSMGSVKYLPSGETVGFGPKRCEGAPRESLLESRNPTCDLRTYTGGISTCHHGWMLLDADQEVPWQDQPLEYYKKFRIYFQEYNGSFHKQIIRHDWGIGADGDHSEYDVIQCPAGTPTEECRMTISGSWMPVPASQPDMYLVKAHNHCHAPTCLMLEIWNNDTGKLLCRQRPVYGGQQGDFHDLPAYSEPGYIATPPCLWGSPEHGLEPPPLLTGVTIRVVAKTNSTYGHHGEMALPEISLVQGPLPDLSRTIVV